MPLRGVLKLCKNLRGTGITTARGFQPSIALSLGECDRLGGTHLPTG
jgi:hypothetical protein